jgi:AcrR family transcriptional regulator
MTTKSSPPARRSHAERSAASRRALLDSAARGLAQDGYANLNLERVAREAGYTRGALYHQFDDKAALAIAAIQRAERNWRREVGVPAAEQTDAVQALVALARGHAVFARRELADLLMTLRVEFRHQTDHPVGQAVYTSLEAGQAFIAHLISMGRKAGAIPKGAPDKVLAKAYYGALEGVVSQLSGEPKYDEKLAEDAVLGVLGIG